MDCQIIKVQTIYVKRKVKLRLVLLRLEQTGSKISLPKKT